VSDAYKHLTDAERAAAAPELRRALDEARALSETLDRAHTVYENGEAQAAETARACAALWKRAAKMGWAEHKRARRLEEMLEERGKILALSVTEITRLKVRLENAEDFSDQEVQERWAQFVAGCPFQDSDDACGHDENLTPECTVWACPTTINAMIDTAMSSECARCDGGEGRVQLVLEGARIEREKLSMDNTILRAQRGGAREAADILRAERDALRAAVERDLADGYGCPFCKRGAGHYIDGEYWHDAKCPYDNAPDCQRQAALRIGKEAESDDQN
jgi:hypothetical protein